MFLVGMFSGCLAMGLVYGAAIWFYPSRWITRVLSDAGFGTAVLVRPNRSVQVWTAGVGLRADKDEERVTTAEQEMVGVITQWAKTRPLAGYSVAILMTPKGSSTSGPNRMESLRQVVESGRVKRGRC